MSDIEEYSQQEKVRDAFVIAFIVVALTVVWTLNL